MSPNDLEARGRQAAAAVRRSVAEAELSATAPTPARHGPGRLVVAALVIGVVLGGALVVLRDGDGGEEGGIASSGEATRLAPTELPEGMAFTGAFEGPIDRGPYDSPDLTVYAGPVGSNTSIVGDAIVDPNAGPGPDGPPEVGSDGELHSAMWFDEATGRTVSLAARGVSADEMRTIVAGTTTDDRGIVTINESSLPADVHRVGVVPLGVVTPSVSAMAADAGAGGIGYADEGQSRVLEVAFAIPEPHWLDGVAATMDDAREVEVRGRPGFGGGVGSDLDGSSLAWVEDDGTFVRLVGWNLELEELQAVAESLEPLTAAEWQAMLDESDLRSGGTDGGSSSGTAVESPTTFEGVGERIGANDDRAVWLVQQPDGSGGNLFLTDPRRVDVDRMIHVLDVEEEELTALPHRLLEPDLLVGVVPPDTERLDVSVDGQTFEVRSFVHVAEGAPFPGWAYLLELPHLPASYELTWYGEDGSEISVSG